MYSKDCYLNGLSFSHLMSTIKILAVFLYHRSSQGSIDSKISKTQISHTKKSDNFSENVNKFGWLLNLMFKLKQKCFKCYSHIFDNLSV